MKEQTGHLNSFIFGGGAGLEQAKRSSLRFLIEWYCHSSSSLATVSFFRFSFFLSPWHCPGSLDDEDDDADDEDEDENDDEEDDDDAYGVDANTDAGDAERSDWRDNGFGCQRGRGMAVG